jgi:hypothetical protein
MLEYQKMIIQKVSFSKTLFEKELRKTIALLTSNEVLELRNWAISQFGSLYSDILQRCFATSRVMA